MTTESSRLADVRFGRLAPTLSVANVEAALKFYVGVLGFEKKFENGTPVGFAILRKDDAELHITLNKTHKPTVQNVAHLMVDDATALYEHCVESGVRIVKGLRDAEYGLRGFVFSDPDGNRIDVGQRLQRASLPE
jgi:catechol 2,3-dioxygenase-like lactoylglutathione lyase family enzyme